MKNENSFITLADVNVSEHIEKKNNLSYLSWPWAVDQLMRHDPAANWQFNAPISFGDTMMVSCTVTAFGKAMSMHLPVMDHRNQAIKNPDAFAVNKGMMRCLVKAIACHGLGLYIYAGEDLPESELVKTPEVHKEKPEKPATKPVVEFSVDKACKAIREAETRAKAEHYADVAFDRAKNDAEKKLISEALSLYGVES